MLSFPCRVRFAPSPTGNLHLGSLRTALINFLWASKNKGSFVLRIEDTDQKRLVPGCAEQFEETLNHYNLKLNESPKLGGFYWPYVQSQRKHLYKFYLDMLLDSGHAYHCFCDDKRLEILRRNAANQKSNVSYDGRCSHLSHKEVGLRLSNGESSVIRFKFRSGKVYFNDKIFGQHIYEVDESDFIIIKSDGFPTYHFANVVDDHSMQITTVIRGVEWLSSVSKHIQLYEAFGWQQPTWAHLPLITRDGNKKLSKRDADAFVEFYDNKEGYLPLAILNFLLRNGSGIRNFDLNHLYTLDEMIDCFDENLITRKDFMMDQIKLKNYGRLSFVNADIETVLLPEILTRLKSFIKNQNIIIKDESVLEEKYIRRVIEFLRTNEESFCKLSELFSKKFFFFFYWPEELVAIKILEKTPKDIAIKWLKIVLSLNYPTEWSCENLKKITNNNDSFTFSKLTNLIRVALIGQTSGPPILELINFFSENETRNRLMQTIALLECDNSLKQ